MIINLIVATGLANEIGIGSNLLDRFPADMRHFKKITEHQVVIMGRRTFESLRVKPLPLRNNIVLTKNESFAFEDVEVAHTIEKAVHMAFCTALKGLAVKEIFVIGGAEIYQEFLERNLVKRIYWTKIHKNFPDADKFIKLPENWREIDKHSIVENDTLMDFIILEPEE